MARVKTSHRFYILMVITYEKMTAAVAAELQTSPNTLDRWTRKFFERVVREVNNGHIVDLGEFGKFSLKRIKEHKLSFDTTKIVPAQNSITFSPDDKVKDYLNGEAEDYSLKQKKPTP